MRGRLIFGIIATSAVLVGAVMACGQGAVGTSACESINHARCKWIEQCFVEAGPYYGLPTPYSNSSDPVDDCDRFYNDACQHGLVTNVAPSTAEVLSCVDSINAATDCTIITNPEQTDACAFLLYDAGDADSD